MIYVSIDTETSGLGEQSQILEFAAVIENTEKDLCVDELPWFHCYLKHDIIVGEPFALAMNSDILYKIATSDVNKLKPEELGFEFSTFLLQNGFFINKEITPAVKVIAAGKNFASFDRQKLEKLPEFSKYIKFHHRVVDPSILFYKEGDLELPNSKLCMERAGLDGEVAHNALDDAKMVIRLNRQGLKKIC